VTDYQDAIDELNEFAHAHFAAADSMCPDIVLVTEQAEYLMSAIAELDNIADLEKIVNILRIARALTPSTKMAISSINAMGNCCAMAAFILEGDAE
jgi:hypothetical protein